MQSTSQMSADQGGMPRPRRRHLVAGSLVLVLVTAVTVLAVVTRDNPPLHRNVRVVPLGATQLIMDDSRFQTVSAETSVNRQVTFMVANQGTRPHQLTIAAPVTAVQAVTGTVLSPLDGGSASRLTVELSPGNEGIVTFTPTAKGTFPITCDVPTSGDMAASLLVD